MHSISRRTVAGRLVGISSAILISLLFATSVWADAPAGLDKSGKPALKAAGPLAFAPNGVLFVADPASATIFALDTGEREAVATRAPINVTGLDAKLAAAFGSTADQILINDLAVNPETGTAYLSVTRGKGEKAMPVIAKVNAAGEVSELMLDKIAYGSAALPNAPADGADRRGRNPRMDSITDMAFYDGKLIIAGLSNEEFASKLRAVAFPFSQTDGGTSVEVYHGAHGAFETRSPVRTFVPFNIGSEPHLLAAYTCTPLVKFPVSKLTPGTKVRGTTVAELGNMNQPLDMIVYEKGGKNWLLLANSKRGVMKIATDNIERSEGIETPVKGTEGQKYDTVADLTNVLHLDKYSPTQAILLVKNDKGTDLQTIALP